MSSYTGFEGYTDEELVKLALARGDCLLTEIAQRFEENLEAREQDDERINALNDNLITDDATTWALLGVLRDADIATTGTLEEIITAGEAYMSLEQTIAENTAAVRELIATLKGAAPKGDVADAPAEKPQPKAEKAKPAPKAEEPKPAAVDRAAVIKKMTAVAKDHGRETVLDIFKVYKAKNLGDVPDEKLAEVEAKFDELLAEQVAA